MSNNNHSFAERRSGKDRRRIFNHGHFLFKTSDKKNLKERRLQAERREGWVRVTKWSSVCPLSLKISR
jgi:hypothetical protein